MTDAPTLEAGEAVAAEGATAPRVTLEAMKARVVEEHYFTAGEAVDAIEPHPQLDVLTVCVLVLDNGWVLLGKSAPAAPENFDQAKGRTFAYEDAIRQLWPLMGFALRDRLAAEQETG